LSVANKFDKVIKRDGSLVDFDINRIVESIYRAAVEVGGRDRDLSRLIAQEVVFLLNKTVEGTNYPSTEEIQDLIEKTMIERGHARTSKAYILHRAKQQALDISKLPSKAQIVGTIPFQKIWNVLVWNLNHQCETLKKLNKIVLDSEKFLRLVKECDKAYEDDVKAAADKVLLRSSQAGQEIKLVIVAGPSSSGKTTTTAKLEKILEKEAGKSFKSINVDNYFWDLDLHPKDAYGDYDFETPQAIDISLFNTHLIDLIIGKKVNTPIYDFKEGIRLPDETIPMSLEKDEVILLDCLHGLYPDLTLGVKEESKFRLYIETLAQQRDSTGYFVRWTDNRLLRRMIRDVQNRGYLVEETLTHWHYVRRSEMQHIIPHVNIGIDHIINGALAYELPIHKNLLGEYFPKFIETYRNVDDRRDAFIRASRVHQIFEELEPATDDEINNIPKSSLIREFIGGLDLNENN
jgi:uridine kinase